MGQNNLVHSVELLQGCLGNPRFFLLSMAYVVTKMLGNHYGDRSFDVFDWVPLIAVLVAGGFIVAGLFPNGFNTLGITNGNLVSTGDVVRRAEGDEVPKKNAPQSFGRC